MPLFANNKISISKEQWTKLKILIIAWWGVIDVMQQKLKWDQHMSMLNQLHADK